MKKIFTLLLIAFYFFEVRAQKDSLAIHKNKHQHTHSHIDKEKRRTGLDSLILLNVYWGGPNLGYSILDENDIDYNSAQNLGPFGAKFDVMLDNNHSLGVDFNYSSTQIKFKNSIKEKTLTRYRLSPRYVYHFGKGKIDAYYHLSAGIVVFKETHNYDNYNKKLPLPALRTGLGMSYLFTKHSAINFEFGLGGPFITGGYCFRFK